jgi:hypothetical protein
MKAGGVLIDANVLRASKLGSMKKEPVGESKFRFRFFFFDMFYRALEAELTLKTGNIKWCH